MYNEVKKKNRSQCHHPALVIVNSLVKIHAEFGTNSKASIRVRLLSAGTMVAALCPGATVDRATMSWSHPPRCHTCYFLSLSVEWGQDGGEAVSTGCGEPEAASVQGCLGVGG